MSELKPCPFCSCVMQIESNRDWHKITGDHGGWCLWNEDTDFSWPATEVGMSNLLKTWNTRHILEGYKLVPVDLTRRVAADSVDNTSAELLRHDESLGRTTNSNRREAEELEHQVADAKELLSILGEKV